jgi:hypothetical protein
MSRPRIIEATFESECLLCERTIYEGDGIVCVDDEWLHAECAEEEGEEVE